MNTAQKIAKESIISFSGIFYGSINRYLYSALLARWVGPEYLGIYSMANAIMLISEVLSKMGMETGTMRFISRLDGTHISLPFSAKIFYPMSFFN